MMNARYCTYLSALLLLLASMPPQVALAADTIYARTGDDGAVSLSNVPAAPGYRPLIGDGEPARHGLRHPSPAVPVMPAKARFEGLVEKTADAVGIDRALLHAVVAVESGYDPAAKSPKGAAGLMQLMPATARRYGVVDRLDPAQNLEGGAKYLRDLLAQYDSDVNLALAAYNAGENAVARYGNRIPPFAETADYVPRVMAYYRKYAGRDQGAINDVRE